MRLYNTKYGFSLELKENLVNNLTVESPKVLSELVYAIENQCNGGDGQFILSEREKELKLSTKAVFISNPIGIELNDKKILTKLYKEISENAETFFMSEIAELNSHIIDVIDGVLSKSPYYLDMNYELDLSGLLKLYNVKLNTTTEGFPERLIDYLRVIRQLCGVEIAVFLNLKQFFSTEILEELYQVCFYNKIHIINLEGCMSKGIDGDKYLIIDKDLCMIDL